MYPFKQVPHPASLLDPSALMARFKLTREQAEDYCLHTAQASRWENDRYHVLVRFLIKGMAELPMYHLSIKRIDCKPIHDWRELQQIKNELVGRDCEGLEVYPAEDRLVDTSNQYHLWVFADPAVRLPLGFGDRLVMDTEQAQAVGATQR